MSVVTIDDRHRLVVDQAGNILKIEDITLYDTLTQSLVSVKYHESIVELLASHDAVVIGSQESQPALNVHDVDDPHEEVWVKNSGKPSPRDVHAREKLIALVSEHQLSLSDKKTSNAATWKKIGEEMVKAGFSFGARDAAIVCKTKWKNMESRTIEVLQKMGPKNSGVRDVMVRDVIKGKGKCYPKKLVDSMPSTSSAVSSEAQESSNSECSRKNQRETVSDDNDEEDESHSSPLLKVKATSKPKKPKVSGSDILNYMKDESSKRDKQNEELLQFLKMKVEKEEAKKDRFLDLFSKLVDKAQ